MTIEELVDTAYAALGGEEADFFLTAAEGQRIRLSCGNCPWGFTIGNMELWEFIVDARKHQDEAHADA